MTAVTVTPHAEDGTRESGFQTQFADNIADEVVGVDIDELEVSRVAGSSLTSTRIQRRDRGDQAAGGRMIAWLDGLLGRVTRSLLTAALPRRTPRRRAHREA